jgi:hypothetical protein
MLYITFGENAVLYILVGVATQSRSVVFNHFVVRMMGVYSLNEISYSYFVIEMMKVYFPKGINRLACGW